MMLRAAATACLLTLVPAACTLDFTRLPRGEASRGDGPGLDRRSGEPGNPAEACATGFTRVDVSSTMAGCACTATGANCNYLGPAFALQQCDAPDACNSASGWHPCTLTEYQKVPEVIPVLTGFWLAGCVTGGQPQDAVCSCATSCDGPSMTVGHACSVTPAELRSSCQSVAIYASAACAALGPLPGKQGFWTFENPATLLHGVVCCHD